MDRDTILCVYVHNMRKICTCNKRHVNWELVAPTIPRLGSLSVFRDRLKTEGGFELTIMG